MLRIQANLLLKEGKTQEAIRLLELAAGNTAGEEAAYEKFWLLEGVARARLARGDKQSALGTYLEAVRISEQVRARFRSEEIKTSIFGNMQEVFDAAIALLMEEDKIDTAWEIGERGRSRALLDQVRNRVTISSGTNVFADPAGKLVAIGTLFSMLKTNEVLVEYHVLPTCIYVWIIRKSGMSAAKIDIKKTELATKVKKFRYALDEKDPTVLDQARALYDLLIIPLGLRSGEKFIIAPHDSLHYLPFQALRSSDSYLIEEVPISYVPSVGTLAVLLERNLSKRGLFLGLGNPTTGNLTTEALPGAQREVERIGMLFPDSEIYIKADATKRRFFASAVHSRIIHIAAHAKIDFNDPLYSHIDLSSTPDETGTLEAHEIYGVNLKEVALVTLSACSSGLGNVSHGDEIWGFTRSFLSAGTTAIVVSLWHVADESTEKLMVRFYQDLNKGEASEALRAAQRQLIKDPRFAHPFYWAPFNLVGDWR